MSISSDREKWEHDSMLRQIELERGLRTRVLTVEELKEVGSYGNGLNILPGQTYDAKQRALEMNNAFLLQLCMQYANANNNK